MERRTLEAWSRSQTLAHRQVLRARIILLAGHGLANEEIARCLNCSKPCVLKWRGRFEQLGIRGLAEAAGRGRAATYDQTFVEAVLSTVRERSPAGSNHWSVRTLAAVVGSSPATVHRILRRHRIQLSWDRMPGPTAETDHVVGAAPGEPSPRVSLPEDALAAAPAANDV